MNYLARLIGGYKANGLIKRELSLHGGIRGMGTACLLIKILKQKGPVLIVLGNAVLVHSSKLIKIS